MKKFKFNLESVLKYRDNIEKYEKGVLSELNARLAALLDELEKLNDDYKTMTAELEDLSKKGITVQQIRTKHIMMENTEFYIEKKLEEIEAQRKLIGRQTNVVVRAMRDTKTIDKLKDIKHKEYVKGENKANEMFIEEFVSHQTSAHK